jgi:hypothetical protein
MTYRSDSDIYGRGRVYTKVPQKNKRTKKVKKIDVDL